MDPGIELKHDNPREKANFLSKLFFGWIVRLFCKAQNGISTDDLFKLEYGNRSEKLTDRFEINWVNECEKAFLKNRPPSLLNVILKTFLCTYLLYGIVLFLQHVLLRSYQPMILSNLIHSFNGITMQNLVIQACLLVSISAVVIFLMHHTVFGQAKVGMQMRIAITSLIYRKLLRLSKKSLNQTSIGNIVNLLSNDVSRFDLVVLSMHYLWLMPFQILFIAYLMWDQVGISCLAGIIPMIILTLPLQGMMAKQASKLRWKIAEKTDNRVTLMSEIVAGIKVIKMYAWEKPYDKMVRLIRKKELRVLTLASYIRGIYLSSMVYTERVTLFLTLLCYVSLGNSILAEKVFAIAQLLNLLQLTMSIFYPLSITYGAETLVAIRRLEAFLQLDEIPNDKIEIDFTKGVVLENVIASWDEKITLNGININIPPGSLCVVMGAVGSGKTSLLNVLLGELHPEHGFIQIEGTISYTSQEPWLFSSTVRNNILFGEPYDRHLYKKVIKVCALKEDFEKFPRGDKMMVGEKGAALSGGQKARINLARAMYRNADVYLLDDPLSAVDTHVGKHIFEECILKYLKGKTRILVTHQNRYLQKADLVLILKDGKIEAHGTYEQLKETCDEFKCLILESDKKEDNPVENEASHSTSMFLCSLSVNESLDSKTGEEEGSDSSISPFREYIKSFGQPWKIFILSIIFILAQLACSSSDYWVTFWTEQEISKVPYLERNLIVYIYSGLIVFAIVILFIRTFSYLNMTMNASEKLHNQMFDAVLRAPMKFFDSNPAGRILNRFSKDMGTVDETLPKVLLESIQITLVMCGILVMVIISNYYTIVFIVILSLIFLKLRSWFTHATKHIKHLEGITKSPVYSHLNSTLHGITTIRACKAEDILKKEFDHHQDVHTSSWILTILLNVSFGLWLDIVSVLFIASTTLSFVILNYYGVVNASLAGLAISQSLILTGMLQYGIRQTAEVISQLTSVERILQYNNIEKEGPFETDQSMEIPKNWPKNGNLQVEHLSLRYSPSDPPVLKNLNFHVHPGEKIGIVGRTGAGKSSIISALFRLTPIEGRIFIDGLDTQLLGLHDLRRNISIIPQEPILFTASLRSNLDPFDELDDYRLWSVLDEVHLKDAIDSLNMFVSAGGCNFSVGQKQLLCLARAILRNNKLLILDEATANIDIKTDALIQETIRKKFIDCTVLTIAHRLDTIMDSDRIIVMQSGKIVEFDSPYNLLKKHDSCFNKMVIETGLGTSQQLQEIAFNAFMDSKH